MKLKINHFDEVLFSKRLEHLKHINFSLFIDSMPLNDGDLSDINILILQEPNEYFGWHDLAISCKDYFDVIMTWDDKVLNNCENAVFLPFGHTWFKSEQYNKKHEKIFRISHLCGNLNKTYGHSLRHELMGRKDEIKNPIYFFQTYGDRYNIEEARIGKQEVFGNSMFGVAIENTSHRGYFTEKILDCFLMRTIPIYWGCSNIGDFFNINGIITVNNVDDMIYEITNLKESNYNICKYAIEQNYYKALDYVDYEQNIIDKIEEIFKINKLI
jgi:hypothetical protein